MCVCARMPACMHVCVRTSLSGCVHAYRSQTLCVFLNLASTLFYPIKGLSVNLEFFDCPSVLAGQSAAGCPCLCTHSTWVEHLCASLASTNMKSPQPSFGSFISDTNVSSTLIIYETKPGVLQWASPGYCGHASCVWGPRAICGALLIHSTKATLSSPDPQNSH